VGDLVNDDTPSLFGFESEAGTGKDMLVNARLRDLAARVAHLEDELRQIVARLTNMERNQHGEEEQATRRPWHVRGE
jgi:hypothetical protein